MYKVGVRLYPDTHVTTCICLNCFVHETACIMLHDGLFTDHFVVNLLQ